MKERVSLIYNPKDRKRYTRSRTHLRHLIAPSLFPLSLSLSLFLPRANHKFFFLTKERERERLRLRRYRGSGCALSADRIILKTPASERQDASRVGSHLQLHLSRCTFDSPHLRGAISRPTGNLCRRERSLTLSPRPAPNGARTLLFLVFVFNMQMYSAAHCKSPKSV